MSDMLADVILVLLTFVLTAPMALEQLKAKVKGLFKKKKDEKKEEKKTEEPAKPTETTAPATTTEAAAPAPASKSEHSEESCDPAHCLSHLEC